MNLLLFTSISPHHLPPPRLAPEQVNCGPGFQDVKLADRVLSLRTPRGNFDVADSLRQLSRQQQPDALAVLVDGRGASWPRGLASVLCPKVLLVAEAPPVTDFMARLADYIRSEPFHQVILLSDRRAALRLQDEGMRNLAWLPGWLFPHADAEVERSRSGPRQARLAVCGRIGTDERRLLRLTTALAQQGLPIHSRMVPEPEVLAHYGSSDLALVDNSEGEIDLRLFQALAAGATTLCGRPGRDSGWERLWPEACFSFFDDQEQLIEMAKHFTAHPEEGRAMGEKGARWFANHFRTRDRQSVFSALVLENRVRPEFALRQSSSTPAGNPAGASPPPQWWGVEKSLRQLHAGSDCVKLVLDHSVPPEIAQRLATWPRVEIARVATDEVERAGGGADGAIVSRTLVFTAEVAALRRLWLWNAEPGDFARVQRDLAGSGFEAPLDQLCYFVRRDLKRLTAPDAAGKEARGFLEAGDKVKALELARATLKENGASWQSFLVLAELALDAGQLELSRRALSMARPLAPDDEGLARLELGSLALLKDWRTAATLARAWQAQENREWWTAGNLAQRALTWDDQSAEGCLVLGSSAMMLAKHEKLWTHYGRGLNLLQLASETNPMRADLWHELAVARRMAGGVLPETVPAYQAALRLDPERVDDWFGLGEALLALDDADGAAAAFGEALKRAPQSLGLWDWLGHARKRQGRLPEAEACHRRALGPEENPRLGAPRARPRLRRAVFVLQNGHGWPCWSSVYDEFVRDPAWETVVVGLPWLHPSFANSSYKDQDKVFDFLAEKRIPHLRWTDFPLTENTADLVFLQNPYDSTRPDGWKTTDLVRAGHRLCYVPYGVEIGASRESLEYQFDMRLHRYAWAIFARSQAHRALFARHCLTGDRHVAVTGHPKFDDLGRSDRIQPDPELLAFARGRPLVLWNPHFDARLNGTRFGDGFSTFMRWRDFFLKEFARRPELAFVIRPHPNFFSALEERWLMTRAQLDRFVEQCASAGVFLHRSPAYFPMLAAADAMISDGSSLLIEFGITGKPVCYLHNPDGPMAHLDYELDFDFVRQHCWWAMEEPQIRSFLDGLKGAVSDMPGREFRAAELRRRMGVGDEAIGLQVKREIEKRLMLEDSRHEALAV